MKFLFNTKPARDPRGGLVFRYGKRPFWLSVACSVVVALAFALEPPTELADIAIALLLLGSALFMAVQTARYELVLRDEVILRKSPWHASDAVFPLHDIREIDIRYKALHATLVMHDGAELSVPFLLHGAFALLQQAAETSGAKMAPKVKAFIDHYAAPSNRGEM